MRYLPVLLVLALSGYLAAQDISIDDFRIPRSKFFRSTGTFSGFFWKRNLSNAIPHEYLESRLSLRSDVLYGEEDEDHAFEVTTLIQGERESVSDTYASGYFPRSTHERLERFVTSVSSRYSRYLVPDRFFLFVQEDAFLTYQYEFSEVNEFQYHRSTYKANFAVNGLTPGIGYGKMRDAGAVFNIVRLLERMGEEGLLVRTISRGEMLELVDIIARKTEYTVSYERFEKFLLNDLFSLLKERGIISTITAADVIRAQEMLDRPLFQRKTGFLIRAGYGLFGEIHLPPSGYLNSYRAYSVPENTVTSQEGGVTLSAEYGYPFSMLLHGLITASANLIRFDEGPFEMYSLRSQLTYQLSDRCGLDLSIFYKNSLQRNSEWNERDWRTTAALTGYYYIENTVALTSSLEYSDEIAASNGEHYYADAGTKFEFGVMYRFQ